MKVLCYGVREVEVPIFDEIGAKFDFELTYVPHLLTHDNVDEVKGFDALMLRANCIADRQNLEIIKNTYGIDYVLTRTAGTNHVDLEAAKELAIRVGYVPVYSPNAIAELAVSSALALTRHPLYAAYNASTLDFRVDNYMFSKEIRNSVVGIVGLGNIGVTTAKLFHGLGATIIGNDLYPKDIDFIEQVDLDTLAAKSDVIVVHCPYIVGENEKMINDALIEKMKDGVVIVNAARGELQDIAAIVKHVKSGKIHGFATDVLVDETKTFGKTFTATTELLPEVKELVELFPKVLVTPHIGSYTDEAVANMVEYSLENLRDILANVENKRILV